MSPGSSNATRPELSVWRTISLVVRSSTSGTPRPVGSSTMRTPNGSAGWAAEWEIEPTRTIRPTVVRVIGGPPGSSPVIVAGGRPGGKGSRRRDHLDLEYQVGVR